MPVFNYKTLLEGVYDIQDKGGITYEESCILDPYTITDGTSLEQIDFGGVGTANLVYIKTDYQVSAVFDNSTGTAITILPNRPFLATCLQVSSLYITNSSGSTATMVIALAGITAITTPVTPSPSIPDQAGFYNVMDYEAVGNGTTDDTAAIQAAIDACRTAGGGVVYFPEGTYLVNLTSGSVLAQSYNFPLEALVSNTRFIGASKYASTIKVYDAGTGWLTAICISHGSIEHLGIDGNFTPGAPGSDENTSTAYAWTDAAVLVGSYTNVTDCYIRNTRGSPIVGNGLTHVKVTGNLLSNFGDHGVYISSSYDAGTGSHQPNSYDVEISDNSITYNATYQNNTYMDTNPRGSIQLRRGIHDIRVHDNHLIGGMPIDISWMEDAADGIPTSVRIIDNEIQMEYAGVNLTVESSTDNNFRPTDFLISNNTFRPLPDATIGASLPYGVRIQRAGGSITENKFRGIVNTAGNGGYGIYYAAWPPVTAGTEKWQVSGNTFRDGYIDIGYIAKGSNIVGNSHYGTTNIGVIAIHSATICDEFDACFTGIEIDGPGEQVRAVGNTFVNCTTNILQSTPTDPRVGSHMELSGTAAPTTGTWVRGDHVRNTSAGLDVALGWVCTASGTPGTWTEDIIIKFLDVTNTPPWNYFTANPLLAGVSAYVWAHGGDANDGFYLVQYDGSNYHWAVMTINNPA